MQGTQSSIVPDMTERRSLASRQRANEAVLAAMDVEEAEQGRPAWLQHWVGEEQRPVAFEGGRSSSADTPKDEAGVLKAATGTVNGYSGQSIEAAFAYETVFHFETELEAESTEDWLDLSPALSGDHDGEASLRLSREVEETRLSTGTYHLEANPNGTATAEDLAAPGLRAPSASIDPKAVRAAIFRLAQGASSRWQPGDRQSAETQEAAPAALSPERLATDGRQLGRSLFSDAQADFAEVAQHVWTTEIAAGDGQINEKGSRIQTEEPEGSAQSKPAAVVSFQPEAELTELELLAASRPNAARSEGDASGPATDVRDVHSAAAQEQVYALPTRPVGQSIVEEDATAGGAPALAHDAGNLLSALKLYSELLALSGVLQARHSHYAEDLKLLAARSEVLIHRLLQSFTLAERESHIPKAEELFAKTEVRDTSLETQVAQEKSPLPAESCFAERTGCAEQSFASNSSGRTTESPEPRLSNHEESRTIQQTVRYWTDERLSAIHDSKGEAPEDAENTALRNNAVFAKTVAAASSHTDVLGIQSGPAISETVQTDETVKATTTSESQGGESVDSINLVELLTRWGGLLSMIARGPVQVNFGPNASLPVRVGEEALERILVNLVHNAMEATRDGGSVRIGVGRPETRRSTLLDRASVEERPTSRMVLTVDDSGCGMTEQQVARALGTDSNAALHRGPIEVYPSTNALTPRRRGHGLGLQIVRELVASSGGQMAIYSRRGAGTRIEIQWPVLAKSGEEEELPQRIPPATVNISSNSKSQGSFRDLGTSLAQGNLEGAIAC